jgi:hypothetical protein
MTKMERGKVMWISWCWKQVFAECLERFFAIRRSGPGNPGIAD